ncbi:MAG TPA: helix-turn-helix transcriptional regulator [Solirubrobacterales bacterium]|nr:helix-turn-helix transcriptional regulator [Solirubrobacterales bacterium]
MSVALHDQPKSLAAPPSAALVDEIRVRSGLSQAELARRAGLPRSVVNAYVKGNREPGGDTLARLAAAGGFELGLACRASGVDKERAGRILVQVLELAEALPFRPRPELDYPRLADRLAAEPRQ